jgi:hypothetical protein
MFGNFLCVLQGIKIWIESKGTTVKASNFWPFLARSVASLGEILICTKNEQDRICKSAVFLRVLFIYHSVGRVLMIASPHEKESKLTSGPKLEVFTVHTIATYSYPEQGSWQPWI